MRRAGCVIVATTLLLVTSGSRLPAHASNTGPTPVDTLGASSAEVIEITDSGWTLVRAEWKGPGVPYRVRPIVISPSGVSTEIAGLGGDVVEGVDISETAWVAGSSRLAGSGIFHAYRWNPKAGITDLGTLGGNNSISAAVNDSGIVVGNADAEFANRAFRWTPGTGMVDLGTLDPENESSWAQARAINNHGLIVGVSSTIDDGGGHATSWDDAGAHDLGTIGDRESLAQVVNDNGTIAGTAADGSLNRRAWIIRGDQPMADIGDLGGVETAYLPFPVPYTATHVNAINEHDQIVGSSSAPPGNGHAYLFTPGRGMIDLGTLGGAWSIAEDINEHGQVVGRSANAADLASMRAFVVSISTPMRELGTFLAQSNANTINNNGAIGGFSNRTPVDPMIYRPGDAALWTTDLDVVVHWSTAEHARIGELMALYDMDYDELIQFGVFALAYIDALFPSATPTPVTLGPPPSAIAQRIRWQPGELALLNAVNRRWQLDDEGAHRYGYMVLNYFAILQGA